MPKGSERQGAVEVLEGRGWGYAAQSRQKLEIDDTLRKEL